MRVSVCVGDYATTPYCIPGLELNVYSMEELCYCMKENAYLLDFSLMNDGLIDWIERQCGLKDLARELYQLAHKSGSLSAFAVTILAYTGLYDGNAIRETEQILKMGAGLSTVEKRKGQIDHLVRQKKYLTALRGYDQLLENWGEFEKDREQPPAASTRAAILHNKGVAYAGLMRYGQAAECFLEAYGISGSEEDYTQYLAAKRMELPESEYVSFAAEHAGNYQHVLKLEKKLEQFTQDWELQPEYLMLYNRRELRGTDRQKYNEENDSLVQALKSGYRKSL
ncbi:MAG: hypothetical protein NC420_09815 [Eubacterium sp.]|nr:hypothetical protein [Eubacterium sp.]MCM1303802.1 hypothetical protein [Butyrivibrio sp.]MCM1342844.1 hypothetical protein [Muribaculaceae bacterium]MCM1410471.1 hypothetical protein [Lachnospiraceae bacterium]